MKTISYEAAFKTALKFVAKDKKNNARPFLTGVYHTPDHLIANDGMQLIQIRIPISTHTVPQILNKDHGNIKGTYPDTSRIIPQAFQSEMLIDVAEWLQAAEGLHAIRQPKSKDIDVSIQANTLSAENPEVGNRKYTTDAKQNADINILLSSVYLINVLKAFKALKFHTAVIGYNGHNRPIVFQSIDKEVLCLIAPKFKRS